MLASHVFVNTDYFSETHRISCRTLVGPTGLMGLLNDNNTSLADVENAYFSRLEQPAKIMAHYDRASLSKANLIFVIVNRREDLGPAGLMRSGFSVMVSAPVWLTTPTFEVNGTVEVPNKLDAHSLLMGGTGKFMPIYKATVVPTMYPDTSFAGEVIVVNRTRVEALAPMAKGKA